MNPPIPSCLQPVGLTIAFAMGFSLHGTLQAQTPKSLNNPQPSIDQRMLLVAAKILQTTDGKPVQLGDFTPTNLQRVNFGPGLRGRLQEALLRENPQAVASHAAFIVKGDYSFSKSRENADQPRDIKITARVIDGEFDEELVQIPVRIDDPVAIAEVLGITGAPPAERNSPRLEQLFRRPSGALRDRTRLAAADAGQVEVEVYRQASRSSQTPCVISRDVHGDAKISLQRDDVYFIRIHNLHPHEIAARVSIDGLSTFHFSDASARDENHQPIYNHYIVAPQSAADVQGWFIRVAGTGNTRQFRVSGYADSAAGRLGIPESNETGVIHVQISETETRTAKGGERGKSLGTALGQSITVRQTAVEREVLDPHEFVTIRYDRPNTNH